MNTTPYGRDHLMAVSAVRYAIGRASYIVGDTVDWLCGIWTTLPENVQNIIRRDINEAFLRDDEDRADCRAVKALGHDCDRAQWERARQLWREQPAPQHIPSPAEAAERLRRAAAELLEIATNMAYFGGFNKHAVHRAGMTKMAAQTARLIADALETDPTGEAS